MTAAPPISKPVLRFFRSIVRGYFRRHFRAVRVSKSSDHSAFTSDRLIVYANHSSWWDPMVSVLLGEKFMPGRNHYAPMKAEALQRYGILRRIGVFPVETESSRGAVQFLRTGTTVVEGGGVLWVTPQGRFADARERPLVFKPGLAALAARIPGGCTVLPLAIEYVFWDERLPEVLLHIGRPIHVDGEAAGVLDQQLNAALLESMNVLRQLAIPRDGAAFDIMTAGDVGAGGFYQLGQRAIAWMRGQPYQAEHTAPPIEPGVQPGNDPG